MLLSHLFNLNPNIIFLTTYKNRSLRRTLIPYLDAYEMDSKLIPLSSFLHSSHFHQPRHDEENDEEKNNEDCVQITLQSKNNIQENNNENQVQEEEEEINYTQNLPQFTDIYLIQITKRKIINIG